MKKCEGWKFVVVIKKNDMSDKWDEKCINYV